jgi:hypothetical protein
MKFNKNTLLLSLLTLVAATQPAYGMYESVKKTFNNNPYVKYGTVLVAGVSIGASLVYYLTMQPKQYVVPELKEIQVLFYTGKKFLYNKQEDIASAMHRFWTEASNLETLRSAETYYVTFVNSKGVSIICTSKNCSTSIDLQFYQNTSLLNTNMNFWQDIFQKNFVKRDIEDVSCLSLTYK